MSLAVRRCAVIGGGVIGAGWAARFVLNGLDVALYDPHPDIAARVQAVLDNAARAQGRLTLAPAPPRGALRYATSIADAVAGCDLVQENAPEREDLKRMILGEIDLHAAAGALVCSSTSGLLPTQLQSAMRHPGRFVVAHPFNPVYLLPLVELCGGQATAAETIARARDFYAGIGMRPLHVRKEIDGFIADRLLEALWREALWLVHDGIATTEEVDDAIRYGAGLRWAFMGTFLVYRLAGGEEGMRHFMAQFGPALKLPWTKLMDVPELTPAFIDTIAEQSDQQAGGVGLRPLEQKRDDCLVAILQALRGQDFGAGKVLAEYESRLHARASAAAPGDPSQPLALHAGTVRPDWVDYNGHMTESRYLHVFGETTDALLLALGADAAYRDAGGSFYTVETHLSHLHEIAGGQPFAVTTQILGGDDKRLHVFHRMRHAGTDTVLATAEQMLLHVDTARGRAGPAGPVVAARAAGLRAAHAGLPRPEQAGRAVGERLRARPDADRFLDPEIRAFIARTEAFYPEDTDPTDIARARILYDALCNEFRTPRPPGVAVRDSTIDAAAPARRLPVRRYGSGGGSATTLLYLHGGGFVVGGLDSHDGVCAELCALTGLDVVALDYRLAPEHPYPAALDDAEAAYRALLAEGRAVAPVGDSAGGNLAAALCLRLRRLGDAQPPAQILIYPGLGGDPAEVAGTRAATAPMLTLADCLAYARAYAGPAGPVPSDDPEFAPLAATDLAGLAPAAILAAGFDPLRQGAEDYAALLHAAGVKVIHRTEPGLVHGWLRARHSTRLGRANFAALIAAVRALLVEPPTLDRD